MGSRKHMPLGEHEESHACLLPRMRSATAAAIDPSPIISEKSSQCKYGHACYSYTCMLEVHVHQGMCMNARVHVRMSVNMYVFSRCVCMYIGVFSTKRRTFATYTCAQAMHSISSMSYVYCMQFVRRTPADLHARACAVVFHLASASGPLPSSCDPTG